MLVSLVCKAADFAATLQVRASDPNDIMGPAGFGDEHFVRPEFTLPYVIRFENKATATAPAQEVFVTQQLDPDLDFSTFEFGDFGFGDFEARVPDGLSSISTRVVARDSLGVFVDVVADINDLTGLITWKFTSIDPATFDLPSDPFGRFLPANQMPPIGEGFVTYRVRPKTTSPTGTRINALATIVFDTEAPLDTPPIFNTIDANPPTSSVGSLPTTSQPSFNVTWSGADTSGSGVATFDVFVSVDGGAFTLSRDDTPSLSGQFFGQGGHMYAFYSVATDNVGHTETAPTTADTSTTTTASEPGDYDRDGIVEADDYLVWRRSFGQTGPGRAADGNQDGVVDAADYLVWRKNTFRIVQTSLGDYNLDNIINHADYSLWRSSFGAVGDNLAADGNRDRIVDAADYAIWRSLNRSIVILPAQGSAAQAT